MSRGTFWATNIPFIQGENIVEIHDSFFKIQLQENALKKHLIGQVVNMTDDGRRQYGESAFGRASGDS